MKDSRALSERSKSGVLSLPYVWIVVVGFVVHSQTLFFGFSHFDDSRLILESQDLIGRLSFVPKAFNEAVFHSDSNRQYYRPLLTVSFVLDAQWGGSSPFAYHLTNVLLHLAASCLVCGVMLKLKVAKRWTLFFSLLFAVHPSLVQAVAWIPGRNDTLLAVLVLLAFLFMVKFAETGRFAPLVGHAALWTLALLTKETAIVLPLLCIAYFRWIQNDRILSRNGKWALLCWLVVGGLWFMIRSSVLNARMTGAEVEGRLQSLLNNTPALIVYLGKVFFPLNLSVYPILQDSSLWYGLAAVLLAVILLSISRPLNWKGAAFGILWFVLFIVPSLAKSNVSVDQEFLDHRIYLSLVGWGFVLSAIDLRRVLRWPQTSYTVTGIGILVLFSILSIVHGRHFHNRLAFWQNAVAGAPSSAFVHNNLGSMYFLDNHIDKAETEWRTAAEINPAEKLVHGNLGLIYMKKRDFENAERKFREEFSNNPHWEHGYYNLALLYVKSQRYDQAVAHWNKAIEVNPRYRNAYVGLIVYYINQNDAENAARYARLAQERGIRLPERISNLLTDK